MSTITKERIANLIEFNSEGSDCQANAEQWEVHELARIALASLEAEPVADVVAWSSPNEERTCDIRWRRFDVTPGPLYTAPPAPVSVPWVPFDGHSSYDVPFSMPSTLRELIAEEIGILFSEGDAQGIWNVCRRAAMLQGADGNPELTVWYGSMPETNGKTNWTAMLHRKGQHPWEGITIDCSEYPDRVRYEADRMRHLIGELADEPDILAYDADAHSGYVNPGNSPVTPDGWVACVERMPSAGEQVLAYRPDAPESNDPLIKMATYVGGSAHGHGFDCYCKPTHWMPLPAAPQQEVKP
ncbi:DUF551 domain-containing protein [Citrobacter freundii]|uniref:DUF551 domain-containing protein n=1 Tax=Citrobacter freundii TaxID=546 RepID=UPI001F24B59A|nr:DUF551 domain-containing protein [Citrobacter freundii]MCF0033598.1 DUF551 domain-containing protein [Citrobacter freundii]